jgi:beta-lactamase superfamily II metal-dependent hydrolase
MPIGAWGPPPEVGDVFTLTMLPAHQGDALWIEYGEGNQIHRILIDGGTPPSAGAVRKRISNLPEPECRLELFMVTHVDTDHIGGVLRLLSGVPKELKVGQFWFNERRHLQPKPAGAVLGPLDGEILGSFLDQLGWDWNTWMAQQSGDGPEAVVVLDGEEPPPSFELPGGMVLTLLSPGLPEIETLRVAWKKELDENRLDPTSLDFAAQLSAAMHRKHIKPLAVLGDVDTATVDELADQRFVQDDSPANGSSIGVLLEFDHRSCLLTGDAVPGALIGPIKRLLKSRGKEKLRVDAVKLPHHGSQHNVNEELLDVLSSSRWLFSTNGQQHNHPDPQAVARVVRANQGKDSTLHFNYPRGANARADRWSDRELKDRWGYQSVFASNATDGLLVDLTG